MYATGGGGYGSAGTTQHINSSLPTDTYNGWVVWMNNTSASSATFDVYVICTTPSSISAPEHAEAPSK